eukprot:TRINITY_DN19650_c0_g1_i2.p1 TRINITY_DN19650_c0_g1~~TRINITY_DN19650_c0_g1_i2.p1  ORF type:complete len:233 (-),score=39.91 TRINITY_DN19650_c0_g1_i2:275-973(-)
MWRFPKIGLHRHSGNGIFNLLKAERDSPSATFVRSIDLGFSSKLSGHMGFATAVCGQGMATKAGAVLPSMKFEDSTPKMQREVSFGRALLQQKRNIHFVQSVLEEYEQSQHKMKERSRDIVHFNLGTNNTFVTVSDENGKTITTVSAGCLKDVGRLRSKFATEAVAEHVGQLIRNRGRPIIVKVKGQTFFSKKKAAILGLRKGLGRRSLITYVEDVTRLPHGGCRLRKRRRI